MKSFGMAIDLKNDPRAIESYKEYHTKVWPEVLEGLRDVGITKMKIFLLGRRLFMYYEAGDDFEPSRDFQKYQNTDRAKEWDSLMREFQEPVPESKPGDWWTLMTEVFSL